LWGGPNQGTLQPTAFRAPLLPLTLAALYEVTGVSVAAGRFLLMTADALAAALLVLLGARLAGRRVGVVAGATAAVYPPLFVHTGTLLSEPLFGLVVVGALLAADAYRRRPGPGAAWALGLLLGAAALGRPNGFLLSLALASWVVWAGRRLGPRPAMAMGAGCMAAMIVVVGPWIALTGRRLGSVVPVTTTSGPVAAGEYASAMLDWKDPRWGGWDAGVVVASLRKQQTEVGADSELKATARRWVVDHPGGTAKLLAFHVLRYFDLYWRMGQRTPTVNPTSWFSVNVAVVVSWWIAAALAVAGAAGLSRQRRLSAFTPALVTFAVFCASGVFLAPGTRYRAPSEPVVLLLAAVALTGAARKAPSPDVA
jgi:4-amino-4-deoxy-L-arabinose transferase-like glycosyltransferase